MDFWSEPGANLSLSNLLPAGDHALSDFKQHLDETLEFLIFL
jgi:hypothetical protein